MKMLSVMGIVLLACVSFVAAGGCQKAETPAPQTPPPPKAEAPAPQTVPAAKAEAPAVAADVIQAQQKICPVRGSAITKTIFTDYQGRRIYFCCPTCVDTFNKDPQKYIKIVDAELAAQAKTSPAK